MIQAFVVSFKNFSNIKIDLLKEVSPVKKHVYYYKEYKRTKFNKIIEEKDIKIGYYYNCSLSDIPKRNINSEKEKEIRFEILNKLRIFNNMIFVKIKEFDDEKMFIELYLPGEDTSLNDFIIKELGSNKNKDSNISF